jgi:PhnB protein
MEGTNTKLNPYLAFNGNCREAMTFYKDALHSELNIQTFGESPMEVPPEQKDRVMHATLTFGDAIIMASDGTVVMPWEKTFWGAMFGICKDKFGIDLMVNVELKEE